MKNKLFSLRYIGCSFYGALACLLMLLFVGSDAWSQAESMVATAARQEVYSVVNAQDGNLYVGYYSTSFGSGIGMVSEAGVTSTLYQFSASLDIATLALIQGPDGALYGVTRQGGAAGYGMVFRLTLTGTFTDLHDFCTNTGCLDGNNPNNLILATDGKLYGTTGTLVGSPNTYGTFFSIDTAGSNFSTIVSFVSNSDGYGPARGLLQAADGDFYGVNRYSTNGSAAGHSILYRLSATGALSVVHTFCQQANCSDGDGQEGDGSPTQISFVGSDGALYGVTEGGGTGGVGVAYRSTTSGTYSVLHSFCSLAGCPDGSDPENLILGSDGNFYGSAESGGGNTGGGTFYQLTPAGVLSTLYDFCPTGLCVNGAGPNTIVQANDGTFYGTTYYGYDATYPTLQSGQVFRFAQSPSLDPPVQLSLSPSTIAIGHSATLSWLSSNSYGDSAALCFAFSNDAAWNGKQATSGTLAVSPSTAGTYTYALTCGGIETGFTTLTVTNPSPGVTLSPASLFFASQTVGSSSSAQAVTLTNTGGSALSVTSISVSGDFADSQNCGGSVAAGASCALSVTFTPTASGSRSGALTIIDNATGSPQTVTLSGTGIAATPGIILSPASLTFASATVGTASTAQTITLSNPGTAALTLTSIAASGDFAQTHTCGTSVAAGSSCTISVTFTPTAAGSRTGTISITDNASGSPQTVSLSGGGESVSVSSSVTGLTISSPGGSATATIQVAAVNGFTGAVNMTCAVNYQGQGTPNDAPTCSLSPSQVQTSGTSSGSSTLTVSTTAATAMAEPASRSNGTEFALAALIFLGIIPRKRWRGGLLLAVLCLVAVGGVIGCSGSNGGSTNTTTSQSGTTTGSYQVVITATSGTATTSTTIPLSLQ